jgi:hypothetical protein
MWMKFDTISKLGATALLLLGAVAVSHPVSAAPERPEAGDARSTQSNLSEGQKLVIEIENEKARLGVRGFSPLRDFPVGEVKWGGAR